MTSEMTSEITSEIKPLVEALSFAINFLEAHPEKYSFYRGDVPESEDERACLLGWIGYFGNVKGNFIDVGKAYNLCTGIAEAVGQFNGEDYSWRDVKHVLDWANEVFYFVERKLGLPKEWKYESEGEQA